MKDDLYRVEIDVDRIGYLAAAAYSIGVEGLIYAHPSGDRCDEADHVMAIIEAIEREARRVSDSVAKLRHDGGKGGQP